MALRRLLLALSVVAASSVAFAAPRPAGPQRALRVAILGAAVPEQDLPLGLAAKLVQLGTAVGRRSGTLFTGACPGAPHIVARATFLAGGTTIGVSPARSLEDHVTNFKSPTAARGRSANSPPACTPPR